jgi:tol-pal system protein YbgF
MRIFTAIFLVTMAASSHADSVKERLTRLEQQLSSKAYMGMWQSMEQLRNEMRNLRGEIEQQSFQLQQFQQQQEQMYVDLDQRLKTVEKAATVATTPHQNTLDTPGSDQHLTGEHHEASQSDQPNQEIISETDSATISSRYDNALQTLRSGHYQNAAKQFEQIVALYPNSDLADNAQYWLAETMYINRDFDSASAAFQHVINRYPLSSKVADALLKIAFIKLELNEIKAGKQQLQALIQTHPQSSAAKLAQQRLNQTP